MSQELLKAWVHYGLLNPIDEHHLAHAQATKELLDENARYIERIEELTTELEFYKDRVNKVWGE